MAAATALGLALRLYQLARPGFLLGVTEYDDGVYFGSALRLVHGTVPYRDFVLVQPPAITLLMAPLALLAKATGSQASLAVARVLTACAGTAGVALAGLLVRHRGVVAVTLACGILAVYSAGLNAAHTVLLEPWLVAVCLAGALALFSGDSMTTVSWRRAVGGLAFGFAGAIKLWAAIPALMILVVGWRTWNARGRLAYLGGVAAGFWLPVAPFAVLAPAAFHRDVIAAQVSRVDVGRASDWLRLASLTDVSDLPSLGHAGVIAASVAIAACSAGCGLAASRLTRRPPAPLEWFALGSAALTLAAFLWPADYYPHYGWFFAPFLALSVALPAARLAQARAAGGRLAATVITAAGACVVLGMAAVQAHRETGLTAASPAAAARRAIPAGACVLTDLPALTVVSDRFSSSVPGCSPMVDAIGTDYALSGGRNGVTAAGAVPAVRRAWLSALRHAQFVWLQCAPGSSAGCLTDRRIPWTPVIKAYFVGHFRPVLRRGAPANLYDRRPADTSGHARPARRRRDACRRCRG